MGLVLAVLVVTWGGLAAWTYLDRRACRRCREGVEHRRLRP